MIYVGCAVIVSVTYMVQCENGVRNTRVVDTLKRMGKINTQLLNWMQRLSKRPQTYLYIGEGIQFYITGNILSDNAAIDVLLSSTVCYSLNVCA
jgi:hypothetical protein